MRLGGVGVSSGRACAPLVIYLAPEPPTRDPEGSPRGAASAATLDAAVEAARAELAAVVADARARLGEEHAGIFEVQLALLDDPEWIGEIRARVRDGAAPTAAVAGVSEEVAEAIGGLADEYLRERGADVLDLGRRVLRLLAGASQPSLASLVGGREVVVAAYELTPSDTLALDPSVVKAIVTEAGGRTSHTAILARQLGIPAVVSIAGLLERARDGMLAAVDGDSGACELEPSDEVVKAYTAGARARPAAPPRSEVAATLDGTLVHVLANAASPADVRRAVALGADGVGLFRTEFLFLGVDALPDERDQALVYADAAESADGRPIVFRTLDIGGDKQLPLLGLEQEANPFLGVRGVRFSLGSVELFEVQLRALARTAERYPNVRIMVPMISTVEELELVRSILDGLGVAPASVQLGAMVEVPSAALLAAEIARVADFLSVGTNDLTQYLLAVDRTNERLVLLYNELHPAVLRVLQSIAHAAVAEGTSVSICGELASRTEAVPLLVGLGYRQLSVVPSQVQPVKEAVSALAADAAAALAQRAVASSRAAEVEDLLGVRAAS